MDDRPSRGAAPRVRLRADRNVVALACDFVRAGPAPDRAEVNLDGRRLAASPGDIPHFLLGSPFNLCNRRNLPMLLQCNLG
jgi:hypothetical protein